MTGGTHSQGAYSKILFEPAASPHTFDASSEAYEFLRHDIRQHGRFGGYNGIRGTRAKQANRIRKLASFWYGTITMYVSPADLVTLLPKMLGAAAAGSTFSLDEDVPYFGILTDNDYGVIQYIDCKVDRWVLRSRAPQMNEDGEPDLLQLALTIFASGEDDTTVWPVSPPAISTAANAAPYVFSDCSGAVTIQGSTRDIEEFVIAGNNHLQAKYVNALTVHSLCPRDRDIAFACRVPWVSANDALHDQSAAGAAASIVFTNGTLSTTLNFAKLHIPANGPAPENGKQQISLQLSGFATATGTALNTLELQVINDSVV